MELLALAILRSTCLAASSIVFTISTYAGGPVVVSVYDKSHVDSYRIESS